MDSTHRLFQGRRSATLRRVVSARVRRQGYPHNNLRSTGDCQGLENQNTANDRISIHVTAEETSQSHKRRPTRKIIYRQSL